MREEVGRAAAVDEAAADGRVGVGEAAGAGERAGVPAVDVVAEIRRLAHAVAVAVATRRWSVKIEPTAVTVWPVVEIVMRGDVEVERDVRQARPSWTRCRRGGFRRRCCRRCSAIVESRDVEVRGAAAAVLSMPPPEKSAWFAVDQALDDAEIPAGVGDPAAVAAGGDTPGHAGLEELEDALVEDVAAVAGATEPAGDRHRPTSDLARRAPRAARGLRRSRCESSRAPIPIRLTPFCSEQLALASACRSRRP